MQQAFAAVTHYTENLWCAFSLRCGTIGASKRNGEHHDEDTLFATATSAAARCGICDEGSCIRPAGQTNFSSPPRRRAVRSSETAFIPRHGKKLAEHGIPCASHAARQITPKDYGADLLIGMDEENIRNMRRVFSGDPEGKISLLLDRGRMAGEHLPIRGIQAILTTQRDVNDGCRALLRELG